MKVKVVIGAISTDNRKMPLWLYNEPMEVMRSNDKTTVVRRGTYIYEFNNEYIIKA